MTEKRGTGFPGKLTAFDSTRPRAVLVGWLAFASIIGVIAVVLAALWYLAGNETAFLVGLTVLVLGLAVYATTGSEAGSVSARWFFTTRRGWLFASVVVLLLLASLYLTSI